MERLYAIVDIETTGGNASGSCITEIAIIIHNGEKIIERFETLVNPQKEIPLAIFALTGITNDMVRHAPIFDDIAEQVFELLTDKIFVAHNVNFDYSFIRHQLEEAGFNWTAKKLCTVRAARKIKSGFRSYSLGNLCRSLDIPLENQHRAGGDADATAILFSKLLEWDSDGEIENMIKKSAPDQRLPPNLPQEDFDRLPEKPGVYYFYNQSKDVIYVGKAINLKKRVATHFTGHSIQPQRQHFLRDIHGISFHVCATELMALVLECSEIKKLWPTYNRALKRFEPKYGLYLYETQNGYKHLAVGTVSKFQTCLQVFNTLNDAVNVLRTLAQEFKLDHRFCHYGRSAENELLQMNDINDIPDVEQHNSQVENAIDVLLHNRPSYAIIDKGRSADERSCIWVEKGDFYGMGYIPSEIGITEIVQVKEYVAPYKSNHYIMQLIQAFAKQHPNKHFVSTNN